MSTITFNELSQALAGAGCQTEAAECHATLAGLLCAGPLTADWMAQISGGGDSLEDCRDMLEKLRADLQQTLGDGAFSFDLLLPDDDFELSERVEALAHWCQGFLFGLTLGGMQAGVALPGDAAEVVGDFARLAEAEHAGEAEEADEQNYMELCEYVRVGAQLVYEELAASQSTEKKDAN